MCSINISFQKLIFGHLSHASTMPDAGYTMANTAEMTPVFTDPLTTGSGGGSRDGRLREASRQHLSQYLKVGAICAGLGGQGEGFG